MGVLKMIDFKLKNDKDIKVLVVGDFMIDKYLHGKVSRISPEAPVPVAAVTHIDEKVGGAGNVALNIKSLGSSVRILTCIGTDDTGENLIKKMKQAVIDTNFVYRDCNRKTSVKTRVVAQNQQLLRYDEELVTDVGQEFLSFINSNADNIFDGICSVIFSDYGKGILTNDVSQELIKQAKKRNIPVLVDPKGSDYSKYSGATMCTPNLKELTEAACTNDLKTEDEILNAAYKLSNENNIQYILATRSEKGMSLICKDRLEKRDFPAISKEVCDVTGAGDTVISTMAVCMGLGYSLDYCCKLANISASIVISKFGAATATVDEINDTIHRYYSKDIFGKKICTQDEIIKYIQHDKSIGRKIVFTNGCFDLVHAGHISSFRQARSFGDVLIVGVNSDESIRRIKGETRPIVSLENRMKLLEALEMIDYIVPFYEDTPQDLIEKIKPNILVKGKDWEGKVVAGADFLKENGGEVKFIDLEKGLSTTSIIEKILSANK